MNNLMIFANLISATNNRLVSWSPDDNTIKTWPGGIHEEPQSIDLLGTIIIIFIFDLFLICFNLLKFCFRGSAKISNIRNERWHKSFCRLGFDGKRTI